MRAQVLLTVLSIGLAACASPQTRDTTLASAVVGKWSWNRIIECCTRYEQSIEFGADGRFRGNGVRRDVRGSEAYSFDGQWQVKEGMLLLEVTSASSVSPRIERTERIVSVTDMQLVTEQPQSGLEHRAWRYVR